jgi:scytalone dehydratase
VFEQEDEESVVGLWQAQGLHRRTLADGSIASWNAYNYVRHYYRRDAEGKWKLDGLKPSKPLFMDGKPQDVIGKF